MTPSSVDDLWPYALCALPSALVTWSWIQRPWQAKSAVGSWRRRLVLRGRWLPNAEMARLLYELTTGVESGKP